MKKIVVAVDGYSSCGKSTIAKQLAQYAGYTYVDTGAMYRAVALYIYEEWNGLRPTETDLVRFEDLSDEEMTAFLNEHIHISFIQTDNGQHVCLNGEDVESRIRTLETGNLASQVSTIGAVRRFLVAQQQKMGEEKGIVMDGRDIGTVVFPGAELKLFLTASAEVRAQRRYLELREKGGNPVFEDVLRDVEDRDYRDTHRAESPLKQADDAIVIDNTNMTREEQMQKVTELFESIVKGTSKNV
ncbi:MAG: (d)CMP kinase [Paludibacteraceae bacterium]|nr:(d)CMP kinase [Paludibacteraceae bacterium]